MKKLHEDFIDKTDKEELISNEQQSEEIKREITSLEKMQLDYQIRITMPGLEDYWWIKVPEMMNKVIARVTRLLEKILAITDFTIPVIYTKNDILKSEAPFIKINQDVEKKMFGDYEIAFSFNHNFKTPYQALSFIIHLLDITCFAANTHNLYLTSVEEDYPLQAWYMVQYDINIKEAICDNKPVSKTLKYRNSKYTDILIRLLGEERENKIKNFLKDL